MTQLQMQRLFLWWIGEDIQVCGQVRPSSILSNVFSSALWWGALSAEGQYEYKCFCPGNSILFLMKTTFCLSLNYSGDPDLDRALANATAIIRRALPPFTVYKPPGIVGLHKESNKTSLHQLQRRRVCHQLTSCVACLRTRRTSNSWRWTRRR